MLKKNLFGFGGVLIVLLLLLIMHAFAGLGNARAAMGSRHGRR
jgi:hypothetical protein